jgi:hypothetical protein
MSTTPSAPGAQAPSNPRRHFRAPQPIDPAIRRRRIKVARAVCLIARTKCSVSVALRACGLDHDRDAREDVADLLDRKGISRRRRGVRRVRLPETPSRNFETFIPRQDDAPTQHLQHPNLGRLKPSVPPSRRDLAELVAELMAAADPLGDDGDETCQSGKFERTSANAPKPVKLDGSSSDKRTNVARFDKLTKLVNSKPKPPIICANCGRAFQGQRSAKFCGGRCRVASWRARQ